MKKTVISAFADEAGTDIEKQVKAMLDNGITGLEIRGVNGKNISELTDNEAKKIGTKLYENGLFTYSIGSPIGKISLDDSFEDHIEKFKRCLEMANILGAKNIRIFSFYVPKDKACDYKNEVIERLGRLCDIAENSGVDVCHENEKGIYGDNAERCLEILTAEKRLKGIFDPANFIQCGQDTLIAWDMLKKRIKYLHIKDAMPNGKVVPAGEGCGNLEEIIKNYIALGGENLTLEPHLAVFDGYSELEKECREDFVYSSSEEAFKVAADALKKILNEV